MKKNHMGHKQQLIPESVVALGVNGAVLPASSACPPASSPLLPPSVAPDEVVGGHSVAAPVSEVGEPVSSASSAPPFSPSRLFNQIPIVPAPTLGVGAISLPTGQPFYTSMSPHTAGPPPLASLPPAVPHYHPHGLGEEEDGKDKNEFEIEALTGSSRGKGYRTGICWSQWSADSLFALLTEGRWMQKYPRIDTRIVTHSSRSHFPPNK